MRWHAWTRAYSQAEFVSLQCRCLLICSLCCFYVSSHDLVRFHIGGREVQVALPMSACLKPITRVKAALKAKEAGACFTTHFTGLTCEAGQYALDRIDPVKSKPLVAKVGENCRCAHPPFPSSPPSNSFTGRGWYCAATV
jgi:hypothetical protein